MKISSDIDLILATDDYGNFKYEKFVLGIKMVRRISNLDDEKEGRRKKRSSKGGAARWMSNVFLPWKEDDEVEFCPSKSQKLEQPYIRIFSSFSRAKCVFFFSHYGFRVCRESLNPFSASRRRQLFYTSLEHLFSTSCAHNAVVSFITGDFPRVKSICGGPAARCFE